MISGRRSTPVKAWGSEGITIDVDISSCGFVKIPTITTSIEGNYDHLYATGMTSVYRATTSWFMLYIRHPKSGLSPTWLRDVAIRSTWNIEWVAVGYTC